MAAQYQPVVTSEATAQAAQCANCGAEMVGPYCHHCGQKRADRHHFALKHFFGHVLHEFTHLDSNKILRTLAALLFRPGLLTEAYLTGRKGPYINPIRVYLTISALFFLFAWGVLSQTRGGSMRALAAQPRFVALAQQKGIEPMVLAEKIGQKQEKYAALLRFASVLLSGLFLAALYRGAKKYYAEHLVFSLHFYSFDFFFRSVVALLMMGVGAAGLQAFTIMRLVFYPVVLIYLFIGLRRVYRESKAKTVFKAAALLACETALFYAVVFFAYTSAFKFA